VLSGHDALESKARISMRANHVSFAESKTVDDRLSFRFKREQVREENPNATIVFVLTSYAVLTIKEIIYLKIFVHFCWALSWTGKQRNI